MAAQDAMVTAQVRELRARAGMEWVGVESWSGVEWSGSWWSMYDDGMQCSGVQWNGSMECNAVEWNGMDAF